MKLRVIWPGKTKKQYYKQAIDDYVSRIKRFIPLEIVEIPEERRTDRQKTLRVKKESASVHARRKAPVAVVLDSSGKALSSEQFARWLGNVNSDVDFLLGGPAGVQDSESRLLLSLGPMTFPHELARVILLEQIYRALTILRHLPYHK